MNASTEPTAIQEVAKKMISLLGLSASPVGVKFAAPGNQETYSSEPLNQHRYCQAFMKARHGQVVSLDAEGIACPAAAAAFGFKPLPDGLRTGKGLVGFGIVSDPSVGETMFENMPRLKPGEVKNLILMPLDHCRFVPDVIVVEDEVEKLMWVVLAYLHATGGKRVSASTAVLQAACVDSTLIPYLEDRLNYGFSCYGCRDATDIRPGEALVGFTGHWLTPIGTHLEYLAEKAIPASRSKRALASLRRDESQEKK